MLKNRRTNEEKNRNCMWNYYYYTHHYALSVWLRFTHSLFFHLSEVSFPTRMCVCVCVRRVAVSPQRFFLSLSFSVFFSGIIILHIKRYKVTFLINESARPLHHTDSTCLHTSQFRYSMIFTFFPSEKCLWNEREREKINAGKKKKDGKNSTSPRQTNPSYSIWKSPCLFILSDLIPLTLSHIENGNKSNSPCFFPFSSLIELMAFK